MHSTQGCISKVPERTACNVKCGYSEGARCPYQLRRLRSRLLITLRNLQGNSAVTPGAALKIQGCRAEIKNLTPRKHSSEHRVRSIETKFKRSLKELDRLNNDQNALPER